LNAKVFVHLFVCSGLFLASCSSSGAPVSLSAKSGASVQRPSGVLQAGNRPPVAEPAPLADWFADWNGRTDTNGIRVLSPLDHPTAVLTVRNTIQATESWDFDLFVLSSNPGRLSATSVPAFPNFRGQIWDWQQANRGSPHTITASPRGTSSIAIDWPYLNLKGQAAGNGQYYVVLAVSHAGFPDGFTAALVLLQR